MSLELLNYHLRMLRDPVRIAAWREAISRAVRPGDVVVDIGTGSGLLALLACQAGAGHVYAIEESGMIELAREVVGQSPFRDRITFFHGTSGSFQPSRRADVVLGDLLGSFGVTGGITAAFADARERLLKPGGALVPAVIEMFAAPVGLPAWYLDQIDGWRDALPGFDHHRARERAVNQMHLLELPAAACLAAPAALGGIELAAARDSRWRGKGEAAISREGLIHGVAGWCRCHYAADVSATNSPFDEPRTVWRQAVFPVERAVAVAPGDVVEMEISYDNPYRWTVLQWTLRVFSGGKLRDQFRHSTFNGEFLSLEKISALRPSNKPAQPPRASAARRVLDLCDGQRSLDEIQSNLLREFPGQFESSAEASDFIRRLIAAAGS